MTIARLTVFAIAASLPAAELAASTEAAIGFGRFSFLQEDRDPVAVTGSFAQQQAGQTVLDAEASADVNDLRVRHATSSFTPALTAAAFFDTVYFGTFASFAQPQTVQIALQGTLTGTVEAFDAAGVPVTFDDAVLSVFQPSRRESFEADAQNAPFAADAASFGPVGAVNATFDLSGPTIFVSQPVLIKDGSFDVNACATVTGETCDVTFPNGGIFDTGIALAATTFGDAESSGIDALSTLTIDGLVAVNLDTGAVVPGFFYSASGADYNGMAPVPLPAAAWLSLTGLTLLGALRRRRTV